MKRWRAVFTLLAIVVAVGVVVQACSDATDPTPTPVPTFAQNPNAGCSEWTVSFNFCRMRPDFDGCSCCIDWSEDPGEHQRRPSCAQPKPGYGGSCSSKYLLDGGNLSSSIDDIWYCDGSSSCCSGGDPTKLAAPTAGPNPNCPSLQNCDAPPIPTSGGGGAN
jgi:hypothetical protein